MIEKSEDKVAEDSGTQVDKLDDKLESEDPYYGGSIWSYEGFKAIDLEHFSERSRPSVELLVADPAVCPSVEEIVEMIDSLLNCDKEALDAFYHRIPREDQRSRGWISYVEEHLIRLARQYHETVEYLADQLGVEVPSAEYSRIRMEYALNSDSYFARAAQEFSNADNAKRNVSSSEDDLDIFGAICVIEAIEEIVRIIKLSLNNDLAGFTLDSSLQLADQFTFLHTSLSLLRLKGIKERGWLEIMASNRSKAANLIRNEIRRRLNHLVSGDNKSKYRYKDGKKKGKLKIDFIVKVLQKEFATDNNWQKDPPGITVLREEIRNFDSQ